ncbi:hypothetical protein LNO89_10755 [Klebsiella pneumoniae subsp. pneumoniae]|nr:hypothetical protein [Klebsiella pneumoniae subsp. pneumoniae]
MARIWVRKNRHKAFSRLAARCALAGLWFTVSDGSGSPEKGASGDASGKQRAMFSAARG